MATVVLCAVVSCSSLAHTEESSPQFADCRVPVVNRWSDWIVALWGDWLIVRQTVDEMPAVIGQAAGVPLHDLGEVIAVVERRRLPLFVDDATYRFVVPLNTDDGSQGRLIVALQTAVKSTESVRAGAREVEDRRVALRQLLQTHRSRLALEFAGDPRDAAVEVPRADALVQSQLDALDALQADVERCLATVDRFFGDLTAASSHPPS